VTYRRSFAETTFGGFKQSGVGGRKCGMLQALEKYSRRENVVIHLAESGPRFFG
jgi:acyl-CoA reductase-like NAD-dependent aldehyde dehydrogenase